MRSIIAAVLMGLVWCASGQAQSYPARPVRIIVGFGAGGPDTTARILATKLASQSGQAFVVEDHPGATGLIGAEIVTGAPPDGYTLLVAPDSFATLPSLYKKLPFDITKGFIPVSEITATRGSFLVVNPSLPVHSLKELIAYARNPAHSLSYGSSGIGSSSHLRTALFAKTIGVHLVHVPFKSPGQALVALMGDEIQMMFVTASQGAPLIKSGKIRALAYDNPTRAPFLPQVPTMAEAGLSDTQVISSWHGLFARAKTPEPIIRWLEAEISKAVADPHVQQQFKNVGLIPVGSTSEQFRKVFAKSIASLHAAALAAGIKPQ